MEVSDEGDFLLAIERYTAAITLNRNNHVLFSNRSAAYARVGKFAEALEDAKRCHELKPDWPKVCVNVCDRSLNTSVPLSYCTPDHRVATCQAKGPSLSACVSDWSLSLGLL